MSTVLYTAVLAAVALTVSLQQWAVLQMLMSVVQSQAQFLSSVRLWELKNEGKG